MRGNRSNAPVRLACCVFASLLCCGAAFAAEPVPVGIGGVTDNSAALTLADLEQMALRGNPTLAQAAAQIDASRTKAMQAGLYRNPTVGYRAELIGVKAPTCKSTP